MSRLSMVRPPPRLVELVTSGRWRQPSDERWDATVPWLASRKDRLDLVEFNEIAELVPSGLDHTVEPDLWRVCSVEIGGELIDDPDTIDTARGLVVAENRTYGADLAVVLDLRRTPENPRVVASQWIGTRHTWREVCLTFQLFVEKLGL